MTEDSELGNNFSFIIARTFSSDYHFFPNETKFLISNTYWCISYRLKAFLNSTVVWNISDGGGGDPTDIGKSKQRGKLQVHCTFVPPPMSESHQ